MSNNKNPNVGRIQDGYRPIVIPVSQVQGGYRPNVNVSPPSVLLSSGTSVSKPSEEKK